MPAPFTTPGFSSGSPMGRLHAVFGMSFPAKATDAHMTRKKHTPVFLLFFKNPPERGSHFPNQFCVGQLPGAQRSEFPAYAGTLHAAERRAGIRADKIVDEDCARLNLRSHRLG